MSPSSPELKGQEEQPDKYISLLPCADQEFLQSSEQVKEPTMVPVQKPGRIGLPKYANPSVRLTADFTAESCSERGDEHASRAVEAKVEKTAY